MLLVPRKDADANRGAGLESEGAGTSSSEPGEAGTALGPQMALNVSIRSSSSNSNINEVGRDSNGGYSSPTAERPIEHGTNTTLFLSQVPFCFLLHRHLPHNVVGWLLSQPPPQPHSIVTRCKRRRPLNLFHKHSGFSPLSLCVCV